MSGKKDEISLEAIKKLSPKTLSRFIEKMRDYLRDDETVHRMFDEYGVDLKELDFIPMCFSDLDVSAKTDHGIIYFNYKLLCDADFYEDFAYGVHEITHWLQQTTGDGPTQGADDGEYLNNPYEQEGFQNQLEFIANEFGEDRAEDYVDDLLKHHEVDGKEKKEKKDELMVLV
jgi:hypothetical protein